jgi:hypothetical protein
MATYPSNWVTDDAQPVTTPEFEEQEHTMSHTGQTPEPSRRGRWARITGKAAGAMVVLAIAGVGAAGSASAATLTDLTSVSATGTICTVTSTGAVVCKVAGPTPNSIRWQ